METKLETQIIENIENQLDEESENEKELSNKDDFGQNYFDNFKIQKKTGSFTAGAGAVRDVSYLKQLIQDNLELNPDEKEEENPNSIFSSDPLNFGYAPLDTNHKAAGNKM